MSKIDLSTVASGFLSQEALNENFTKLEQELQNKVLYRDNPIGEPNAMQNDLDMNGYRILNALAQGGEGFIWKGTWTTGTTYQQNNLVYIPSGTYTGSTAIVKENYTSSGSADTDFLNGKLELLAARGASGAGAGDMLKSENLSGLTNTSTARSNLGVPGLTTTNTFTQHQTVPDEAYNATTWDGNNTVPTKNAIRDALVSLSTPPEVLNATNDPTFASTSSTQPTSAQWVDGKLALQPFTKSYASGEQTITTGGLLTFTHGLGAVPKLYYLNYVCKTAELNYSVNDKPQAYYWSSNSTGVFVTNVNATTITVRFGSAGGISLANKTTGTFQSATNANWRLEVTAFA